MKQDKTVAEAVKQLNAARQLVRHQTPEATDHEVNSVTWYSLSTRVQEWCKGQIVRCRNDFRYLAGNYIYLWQRRGGSPTTLDLNDSQELLLETIEYLWNKGKPGWLLVHKARQMGVTVWSIAMMVWKTVFFRERTGLTIAQDPGQQQISYQHFKHYVFNLPWWVQPTYSLRHEGELLVFQYEDETGLAGLGNWNIFAAAKKMSAFAQGKTISALFCDELSNWPEDKAARIVEGDLRAALVAKPGNVALLVSKPEGAVGWWYNIWHHYYKLGSHGSYYACFLPVFMEKSRRAKVPVGFRPTKEEIALRERYAKEWRICRGCGKMYYAVNAQGSDLAACLLCGRKDGDSVRLTDEQLGWYRQMKSDVRDKESLKRFKQEFAVTAEEGFQYHGRQVFPDDVYEWVQQSAQDPKWKGDIEVFRDGTFSIHRQVEKCPACKMNHLPDLMPLSVWEEPDPKEKYHMGIDPAYGEEEGSFGVIAIHKHGRGMREPDVQVAEYRARCDANHLGEVAYVLGTLYGSCQAAPEVRAGPGEATYWAMVKMGYTNIWRWKHYDHKSPVSNTLGWVTNERSKTWLINHFIHWSRQKILVIRSKDFLMEMPSYVKEAWDDEAGRAAKGKTDDSISAGLITAFTGHDEDFDYERGRVVVPNRMHGEIVDHTNPSDAFLMTCQNGHQWSGETAKAAKCPECAKQGLGKDQKGLPAMSAIKVKRESPQLNVWRKADGNLDVLSGVTTGSDQIELS